MHASGHDQPVSLVLSISFLVQSRGKAKTVQSSVFELEVCAGAERVAFSILMPMLVAAVREAKHARKW